MSATGLYPAGCLGKLPAFADFVRHNATARETLALDEWIQHGLYHAQQLLQTEWDSSFENAPAYNFIFWPENSDRFLVGYMRPGRDRSGRRYPFVVSLLVDRPRYGAKYVHLAPAAFAVFLKDARQFAELAMDGLDLREIARRVQALSLPVESGRGEEDYRQFLRGTTLRDFCKELFGSFDGPVKQTVFENLADILLPFRQRPIVRLSLGLRFPLSTASSRSCLETSFWLDASLRMVKQNAVAPLLFWTTGGSALGGAAYLFFRPPSPKNFVYLIKPELESDTICVLERFGRGENAPRRYTTLLREESLRLDALLDRLAAVS
jgi:type VI secretion system ImpM family protein